MVRWRVGRSCANIWPAGQAEECSSPPFTNLRRIQVCCLSGRIICISDEAHRSQTNLSLQIRQTDRVSSVIRICQVPARFAAECNLCRFYGTIDATIDVFGEVVDAHGESVADGITRRIVYEGRAAKVLLDHAKLKEIEEYYKQCAEEGERISD